MSTSESKFQSSSANSANLSVSGESFALAVSSVHNIKHTPVPIAVKMQIGASSLQEEWGRAVKSAGSLVFLNSCTKSR